MAQKLLSSSDDNAKFFGALTFTVKLNTDSYVLQTLYQILSVENFVGSL